MQKLKMTGSFLALSALVCGIAVTACSAPKSSDFSYVDGASNVDPEDTGSVGLNLTLTNGIKVNEFTATISGSLLSAPVVRKIPVPNDGATVSALFGGLPAGSYSIELKGTSVDSTTLCGGTANFAVTAKQTTGVVVPVTCNTDSIRGRVTVDGDLNTCPDIDFLFAAPLQTDVGGPISVEAGAKDTDGDTITYAWTASAGTFASASSAATTYTCSAPGTQTLTVTINDGGSCTTMNQIQVNCRALAVCGDGNAETAKGEQCDPPNGTTCDNNCQNITIACGNSIVQPGEQCDPPNGTTCNAACKTIVCGDGVLEGTEQCETPFGGAGQGNCNPNCTILPSVCGNSIKEPGEQCDAPGDASCTSTCTNSGLSQCQICQTAQCSAPKADLAAKCTGTTCDALLSCQASSGCADSDPRACYCGTNDPEQCFAAFSKGTLQNGPCVSQIEALAGTNVPIGIGQLWFDPAGALGVINNLAQCTVDNCAATCP